MKIKKFGLWILTVILLLTATAQVTVAFADGAEKEYYVAFSNQNYAIRNSNKMELSEDGSYYLKKVSLSSAVEFYVTDNFGVHYYSFRGDNMKVDEAQTYRYDIKFSPDNIFSEEDGGYAATNCHITYGFYLPEAYFADIGGTQTELTYNPYFTAYDLYYISSAEIEAGETVAYEEESHEIKTNGVYRILFTPTVLKDGNEYAFDIDGNYGSGEDYIYNLYIEDAAEYFVVFDEGVTTFNGSSAAEISGKPAYALTRYENNVSAEEYRFDGFFVSERDVSLKYLIYESEITGNFRLIDDDNDEDTNVSKIIIADAGWYELSFTVGNENYRTAAEWSERGLDGYYIVGGFNGYGFNEEGGVDIDKKFAFTEVEEEDDDYNEDYGQYVLYITVTKDDIAEEDLEFYITDGKDKYKNGSDYIAVNTAGEYKILFSDEHIYSRGRHYRFTLLDGEKEGREIEISSCEDFIAFAEKCSVSADYSINLSVYLTCDLDFKGKSFRTVKSFGGSFYGGYHSMENISLDKSDGLSAFETVTRTGRIERLNIVNLSIEDDGGEYVGFVGKNYGALYKITVSGNILGDNYAGGVAAFNGVSQIDDNSASLDSDNVVQTGVIEECVNRAHVTGKSNAGGIAGFNSGDILSCENTGSVAPYTQTKSSLTNFGGIAGFSAGKLSDCVNRGEVGLKSYALYVGGVIGFASGENYFSENFGEVSGRKYVGGILGGYGSVTTDEGDGNDSFGGLNYAEIINKYFNTDEGGEEVLVGARHNLIYLFNYGNVYADSYAAGVLADGNYDGLNILNSFSKGNITCVGGGYLGGILGNGNATVTGCFSSGTLKASGASANYVGGIVGNGAIVRNCFSNATLFGSDYVGGIAGNIKDYISSSYTNAVLVCDAESSNAGLIAGYAEGFNPSLNSFPASFKYNYYIGNYGGIGKTEYAAEFEYAATEISSDKLLSENNLSVYLHEYFDHEFWEGGEENSYPVLSYMFECFDIADIDDEEELFEKYSKDIGAAVSDSAKVTYTVTFMEWNKDNGSLYDDGEIQLDNFEEIYSVRVSKGENVQSALLKFASLQGDKWIYEADDGVYFVTLKSVGSVAENTVVYAEYRLTTSTLSTEDGSVLVEGLFDSQATILLERTGEYYGIKFLLGGEEISVTDYTVKFRLPDENKEYAVYSVGEEQTELEATVYGDYLRFEFEGGLFRVCENEAFSLSVLEIVLISVLSVALAAAVVFTVIFLVRKKKRQ